MFHSSRWTRPLVLLVGASLAFTAAPGATAKSRIRPLLPNIEPLPIRTAIVGDMGFYPSASQPSVAIDGCRLDEIVEEGARKCLRFDTIAANTGKGALELRYRVGTDALEDPALVQRVFMNDGSHRDRRAASAELHPIHGHLHYTGFAIARLWESNGKGQKLGPRAVRSSGKNGFCLMDGEAMSGTDPETQRYGCSEYENEQGVDHVTGISAGWADVYRHELADQYIEISGVEDGYYLLVTRLDPSKTLWESSRKDNTTSTLLQLCGNAVEIVGGQHVCTD